jgi:hypothetical protein
LISCPAIEPLYVVPEGWAGALHTIRVSVFEIYVHGMSKDPIVTIGTRVGSPKLLPEMVTGPPEIGANVAEDTAGALKIYKN